MEGTGAHRLVDDFLLDLRGAERVFAALCETPRPTSSPRSTTSVAPRGGSPRRAIRASVLQRLRPTARTFRPLLPLYPAAMEALDLSDYELVVSSSSAWAHGVIVDEGAVHVRYCYNPFRYAWNARDTALAGRGPLGRAALSAVLRAGVSGTGSPPSAPTAISPSPSRPSAGSRGTSTARRASCTRRWRWCVRRRAGRRPLPRALRADAPQRIALAVDAFNQLGWPLVVAGNGPDARRLQRLAGPSVRFEGRLSDTRSAELMPGARALS